MRKLFGYIALCIISMILTMVVIWLMPGTIPHDLAALVNKKEMLKQKKSPRMIFVGGSSQLTLKTALLEKELGYSMIDMSLWGGLGTSEHLDEIKEHVRPGDVVVVTMEYATVLDPKYYHYIHTNEEAKRYFFLMSPARHARQYIKDGEYYYVFKTMLDLCQGKVKSYIRNLILFNPAELFGTGFPNYKNEFNTNGDRLNPYNVHRPLMNLNNTFTYPEWKNLVFLNDFNEFAAKKNVRLLFYFSHFPASEYLLQEKYIKAYYDLMKQSFKGTLLNKPRDFMYPEEYFGDTAYHLNDKGETVRTPVLLKMIKEALSRQ
jgi:hypothetical protein